MLPRALAAVCFVDPELGCDERLAASTVAELPRGRVALLGASRPGLTRALAAHGLDVVVIDSSRSALRRARDELRPGDDVLLLISDPRELEIPGGVDGILVPSAPWRAVTLPTDRRRILSAMARELRPGGSLLLHLERVPPAPATWAPLGADVAAADEARAPRIRSGPSSGTCVVSAAGADADVTFATFTPEDAIDEALAEGFTQTSAVDARTGAPADAATPVVWARLGRPRELGR